MALEAVTLVAKLVKEKRYPAASDVIRSFTALPLRIHQDDVAAGDVEALNLQEDGMNTGRGRGKGKGKGKKSADGDIDDDDTVKADMDEAKGRYEGIHLVI